VAAEHEKMGDKVRIAANRRGRPVNTRKTHGVLKGVLDALVLLDVSRASLLR
jgi:hypothetical protein